MINNERNIDNNERSLHWIIAAYPFVLDGHTDLTFVGFYKSPEGSSRLIDLMFKERNGIRRWVEVEGKSVVDLAQITKYESDLQPGLSKGSDALCWVVSASKSGPVAFPGSPVCIHKYNEEFLWQWADWRGQCREDLQKISDLISQQFPYDLGRSIEPGGRILFANAVDALMYYGYTTIVDKTGTEKRRKVGFHLATLGWNLDLIRNIVSPAASIHMGSPTPIASVRLLYPELAMKLVLEILEAPFRFDDPKSRGGSEVSGNGLVALVRIYKKGGSNWERVLEIFNRIHEIAASHRSRLIEMDKHLKPAIVASGYAHFDLLEMIWPSIVERVGNRDSRIHALTAVKALTDSLGLQHLPRTGEVHLARGQLVENRRADDSYVPYMAGRLVELLVLKGVLIPCHSMYPMMRTLRIASDQYGNPRSEIVGVAEFIQSHDLDLRPETLRITDPPMDGASGSQTTSEETQEETR